MRKLIILIVSLILVPLVLIGCSNNKKEVYVNGKNANKVGNSTNNIMNGGKIARQGAYIYYSSDGRVFGLGKGLYRSTIDFKERKKLIGGDISNINVLGDWVYYVITKYKNINGISVGQYQLYKIKNDGTCNTKILDNCWNVNVVGDTIYYKVDVDTMGYRKSETTNYPLKNQVGNIYSIKTDGSKKTKLASRNAYYFIINGEYIFYSVIDSEEQGIYRVKLDGTEEVKISSNVTYSLIENNGFLYYTNDNSDNAGIYKMKLDGSENIKLVDQQANQITFLNDSLVYVTPNFKAYKIKVGDTKAFKIADDAISIYTFNDLMFVYTGDTKFIKITDK
ncbi:MAG: DUF5050 domain-containing protein [Bacillota bacterium]|nr:DUF5050 domain-containing protein [Bacillota bacterium]